MISRTIQRVTPVRRERDAEFGFDVVMLLRDNTTLQVMLTADEIATREAFTWALLRKCGCLFTCQKDWLVLLADAFSNVPPEPAK